MTEAVTTAKRLPSSVLRVVDGVLLKRCAKCGVWKVCPEEFTSTTRYGVREPRSYCKECDAGLTDEWKSRNPERVRAYRREFHLRMKFGIGTADFDAMLAEQGGVCAICKQPERGGRWNRMHVDHDHQTGKIRGLLCSPCNLRLGWYEANAEGIAAYLEGGR